MPVASTEKASAEASGEAYHNPVDQQTYVAPGGWEKYEPETRRPDKPGQKARLELTRLLTPQAEMQARVPAKTIAAFVLEAERLADATLGKSGRKFRVIAQFNCTPAGHEVKLAYQGDATQELLQEYYEALAAAKKLPLDEGEVAFQVELSVSP